MTKIEQVLLHLDNAFEGQPLDDIGIDQDMMDKAMQNFEI